MDIYTIGPPRLLLINILWWRKAILWTNSFPTNFHPNYGVFVVVNVYNYECLVIIVDRS